MKIRFVILYFLSIVGAVFAIPPPPDPSNLRILARSLDPLSIAEHLALYELYPHTQEGQEAFQKAWSLLSGTPTSLPPTLPTPLSLSTFQNLVALVNKQPSHDLPSLSEEDLAIMDRLAARLPNYRLKGRHVESEEVVLELKPEEIDLARGLFLSQIQGENAFTTIRTYEAMIDLMALQILARLPTEASPEMKIRAINRFIFEEMDFRYPPRSSYAKDIDLYTFLPSVLDSRKGVCLGVSILYLCLAQRLNLNLEMITPPGHIYVRYREGNKIINIETTARGINLPCETYLSVNTRKLQQRNIKEVIGLAHFNQAAVYWQAGQHHKALQSYAIAKKYLPSDPLLIELMAYNYLFVGDEEEGRRLLNLIKDHVPDYAVRKESVAADFLDNNADAEGIKALFMHVDETRASLNTKKVALENAIQRHPQFRMAIFQLANTLLQMHLEGKALELIKHYHSLDPNDPTAEYYLSVLHAKRLNYNQAWNHLRQAEQLVAERNHHPKVLKKLRKELSIRCPE